MYVRKTKDEFEIQGDYGLGYEAVNTEDNLKDARRSLKEYRENVPGIRFRIIKKRINL